MLLLLTTYYFYNRESVSATLFSLLFFVNRIWNPRISDWKYVTKNVHRSGWRKGAKPEWRVVDGHCINVLLHISRLSGILETGGSVLPWLALRVGTTDIFFPLFVIIVVLFISFYLHSSFYTVRPLFFHCRPNRRGYNKRERLLLLWWYRGKADLVGLSFYNN